MKEKIFYPIGEVLKRIVNECDSKNLQLQFIGSFVLIDPEKDFAVIDSRMFAFGPRKGIILALEALSEQVAKEKEQFINW